MITKERSKELTKARKDKAEELKVLESKGVGYVVDVYGSGTSFNVFSFVGKKVINPKFYKSSYSLERAKVYFRELEE